MDLTLSIIKPDAVKRNITGEINSLIEKNDMKIVAQKMIHLSIEKKDEDFKWSAITLWLGLSIVSSFPLKLTDSFIIGLNKSVE